MFKRVQKRQKKKEEEEELGLDEEMKEIMGLQDTDSEESSSDSGNEGEEAQEDRQDEEDEEALPNFAEEGGESDEGEDFETDSITVPEAVKDPVYVVSVQPAVRACIICPGKVLKDEKMVKVHLSSNAHTRRFKQFEKLAKGAHPGQSAAMLVRTAFQEKPAAAMQSDGGSKRAAKQQARLAKFQAMREKKKAKAKARALSGKGATEDVPPTSEAPSESTSKPRGKKKKIAHSDKNPNHLPNVLRLKPKAKPKRLTSPNLIQNRTMSYPQSASRILHVLPPAVHEKR
ncbi:hypothetical protein BDN72DRAFT_561700 [Pluteus cervinus]|uniref:Uncharacterized protein n=1 Tax=Pluteus cervinus TaxID=181527 RepID=A0ACD3BDU4_9AGAR|nr:hypothetical protein BDN72DRAFT_561700 [Pluteus cervinus]